MADGVPLPVGILLQAVNLSAHLVAETAAPETQAPETAAPETAGPQPGENYGPGMSAQAGENAA